MNSSSLFKVSCSFLIVSLDGIHDTAHPFLSAASIFALIVSTDVNGLATSCIVTISEFVFSSTYFTPLNEDFCLLSPPTITALTLLYNSLCNFLFSINSLHFCSVSASETTYISSIYADFAKFSTV